jgi:hypothetical protein
MQTGGLCGTGPGQADDLLPGEEGDSKQQDQTVFGDP